MLGALIPWAALCKEPVEKSTRDNTDDLTGLHWASAIVEDTE